MQVYIETYGCQMNAYDTELLRAVLLGAGHQIIGDPGTADAVLLNTCAVRENAHEKIYHRLDDFKGMQRRRRSRMIVGILGCMAQNLKNKLLEHPMVGLVVGPDNYRAIPELLLQASDGSTPLIDADLSEYETYEDIAPARVEGVNGWIAIMRGCDNFCTFCVVPYTRGRERSRSPRGILAEVANLAAAGYEQVTLLGQNVNSYRSEGWTFSDLIWHVAEVPGIRRVRFTSPHPKDFPDPLLSAIARHPNICKHIHLPLQAGSDRILERMNRTYSLAEYLDLVERVRSIIPSVVLSTDLIVGFPTESEEDYLGTENAVERIGFDAAYVFKYSEREGTIAARRFKDDVSPEIKTDRIVRLLEVQRRISLEKNLTRVGRSFEVLVEEPSQRRKGYWIGKTDGNITVVFPSDRMVPGKWVQIEVEEVSTSTLYGTVIPVRV